MNPMKDFAFVDCAGRRRRSVDLADGSRGSSSGEFDDDHRSGLHRG